MQLRHHFTNRYKSASSTCEKAPKDFWSAMGTISAATVAEQIFQSPGFERLLLDPETFSDFENSPVIFWITDFSSPLMQFTSTMLAAHCL